MVIVPISHALRMEHAARLGVAEDILHREESGFGVLLCHRLEFWEVLGKLALIKCARRTTGGAAAERTQVLAALRVKLKLVDIIDQIHGLSRGFKALEGLG